MYKAKINLQHSIAKSIILTGVIVVLGGGTSSYAQGGIMGRTRSIDTALQQIFNRPSKKINTPSFKDTPANRFNELLKTNNSRAQQDQAQVIQAIGKSFEQQACGVSRQDILTILQHNELFQQYTKTIYNLPFSSTVVGGRGDITQSCTKVLRCQKQLGKDEVMQDPAKKACINQMYTLYAQNFNQIHTTNTLSTINEKDHIYRDGDASNSIFDIMIDMQNINNILFKADTIPEIPQMIYYSLPPSFAGDYEITQPGGANLSPNNPTSGIGNQGGNSTSSGSNTANQNSPGSGGTSISDTISTFINHINNNNNPDTPGTTSSNNSTLIANNNLCLPTSTLLNNNTGQIESDLSDQTIPEDQIEIIEGISEEIMASLSGLLFPTDNTVIGPGGGGGFGNFVSFNNGLPSTTVACKIECLEKENEFDKMICEGNCCLKSCNQLSDSIQKALCLSSCLCGEISVPEDMDILRIKICRVPAQPTRIISGKRISSIEEAIDEISSIFTTLKQNGLLTKRTKTKEFMDSSFSSIKLHQILAFDIFVAVKPIYNVIQISQRREEKNKEVETLKINTIGGEKGSEGERNRYIIGTNTYRGNSRTKQMLSSLKQETQHHMLYDQLFMFSQEHYTLWSEISSYLLGDFAQIAHIFKTKAQQAQ